MKILIADDDPQILRALRITLAARGYEVVVASDGAQAINRAVDEKPDVFILDLGMPGLDGLGVIETVRAWSEAPILVVSGRTEAVDKVEALDLGADDYVTKPFAIDELLARIRALTRRAHPVEAAPVVRFGDVVVDLSAQTVMREGEGGTYLVRLTPTEWEMLAMLVRHAGRLVTRQMLLKHIWGSEHVQDTGYLRLYISQLRKKLEPNPSEPVHLLTEPGMGYRLVLEGEAHNLPGSRALM